MNTLSSLAETLPMPEGQRASLTLIDLKDDTKRVLVAIHGDLTVTNLRALGTRVRASN